MAWGVRRRIATRRAADRAGSTAAELADALGITDELRTGAHPAAALAGHVHDGPLARALLEPAAVAARIGEPVPEALRRTARGPPGATSSGSPRPGSSPTPTVPRSPTCSPACSTTSAGGSRTEPGCEPSSPGLGRRRRC
ncbi:hypothetical protein [Pseudonocardia sp. Ae717_Ps2]|uniref:hypothetical protein n=1 Tax=Pseudonocardia sp. Ae717_Ps2 TaxID=1885573 RepID=UPI001E508173|nr:hypothetical protein [Pseudonocardia sp. Ae717_Ps2]